MIYFSKTKLLSSKIIIFIIFIMVIIVILAWLFIESSKPLPGEKRVDLGRKHIDTGTRVLGATTDPPTSGDHYEDWIRSGIYDEVKDDGYLIHSLEHGYVILSYNCNLELKTQSSKLKTKLRNLKLNTVYAHGIEEEATSSADRTATSSAALSESFKSEQCHKLVDQLIAIYEKKGKTRLIVIPRPNMDSKIALTAWTYLDKLGQFDEQRITKFIDAHLNQGPEKTME